MRPPFGCVYHATDVSHVHSFILVHTSVWRNAVCVFTFAHYTEV